MSLEKSANNSIIEKYLIAGIEDQVSKEFDVIKEQFIENLNARKREICAGIILGLSKQIDVTSNQERVMITIREIVK